MRENGRRHLIRGRVPRRPTLKIINGERNNSDSERAEEASNTCTRLSRKYLGWHPEMCLLPSFQAALELHRLRSRRGVEHLHYERFRLGSSESRLEAQGRARRRWLGRELEGVSCDGEKSHGGGGEGGVAIISTICAFTSLCACTCRQHRDSRSLLRRKPLCERSCKPKHEKERPLLPLTATWHALPAPCHSEE